RRLEATARGRWCRGPPRARRSSRSARPPQRAERPVPIPRSAPARGPTTTPTPPTSSARASVLLHEWERYVEHVALRDRFKRVVGSADGSHASPHRTPLFWVGPAIDPDRRAPDRAGQVKRAGVVPHI